MPEARPLRRPPGLQVLVRKRGWRPARSGLYLGRLCAVLLMVSLLAACAAGPRASAPPEVVARAIHPNGGPAEVTLVTVINNRTGAGDHSALILSGSQRVVFDPAGSFELAAAPRRGDVLYGISPAVEAIYKGYHARDTHHLRVQTLSVSREAADAAIATAEGFAPAGPGFCAVRTGAVLRNLPGLEGLPGSFFPRRLADALAERTGVEGSLVFVDDIPPEARTRMLGDDAAAAPAG